MSLRNFSPDVGANRMPATAPSTAPLTNTTVIVLAAARFPSISPLLFMNTGELNFKFSHSILHTNVWFRYESIRLESTGREGDHPSCLLGNSVAEMESDGVSVATRAGGSSRFGTTGSRSDTQ